MSCISNYHTAERRAAGIDRSRDAGCGRLPNSARAQPVSPRRREIVAALAGWPLVCLPTFAASDVLPGLRRWGSGDFRRFGFLVYHATLWAGEDPSVPPLALRLEYRRSIAGSAIVEASIAEMRQLGAADADLQRWGKAMTRVFPDVRNGDHLTGIHRADGAVFLFNGRLQGEIADSEFARRFFAIWLDPQTSAPALRAALLRRPSA
jgi:hypothetical protein